jgi:hypothetical protein
VLANYWVWQDRFIDKMWTDTGVANDLLFIILLMPLDPVIALISPSLLKKAYELVKSKTRLSMQKTQADLNDIYQGLPFCPANTAAKYCLCLFIILFIVPLHPICSLLGAVLISLFFWIDKLVLLRISNYPEFTTVDLCLSFLRYAEVAIIFHWISYCIFEGLVVGTVRATLLVILLLTCLLYAINLQFYLKKWMRNKAKKAILQMYTGGQSKDTQFAMLSKPSKLKKPRKGLQNDGKKTDDGIINHEVLKNSDKPINRESDNVRMADSPNSDVQDMDKSPVPGFAPEAVSITQQDFFQSLNMESCSINNLEALLDELKAEECFGTYTYWTTDPVEVLWQSIQAIKRFFAEIEVFGPRTDNRPEHVVSLAVESTRQIDTRDKLLPDPPSVLNSDRLIQMPVIPEEPEHENNFESRFIKRTADLIDTDPSDFLVRRKAPLSATYTLAPDQLQLIEDPRLDGYYSRDKPNPHNLSKVPMVNSTFESHQDQVGVCNIGPNKRH